MQYLIEWHGSNRVVRSGNFEYKMPKWAITKAAKQIDGDYIHFAVVQGTDGSMFYVDDLGYLIIEKGRNRDGC